MPGTRHHLLTQLNISIPQHQHQHQHHHLAQHQHPSPIRKLFPLCPTFLFASRKHHCQKLGAAFYLNKNRACLAMYIFIEWCLKEKVPPTFSKRSLTSAERSSHFLHSLSETPSAPEPGEGMKI